MFNMQNELSSLEYSKGVTLTQRESDFNTISTKGKVIIDKSRGTKVFGQPVLRNYDKKNYVTPFFVRNDTICSTALIVII